MKKVKHAWIFDVDGVITNPEEKVVTRPRILEEIIKRLQSGEPVALVTGRSLEWLVRSVLSPLEKRIDDKTLMDRLYVSGEFGGAYIKFPGGQKQSFVDEEIVIPVNIIESAKQIASEFSHSMFFDTTKRTMVSIEMNDNASVREFRQYQRRLIPKLRDVLGGKGLLAVFDIHADRIATNIKHKRANKYFAAKQVANWLKEKSLKPKEFVIFGDAESDLEMGMEIYDQGLKVRFVFVGGQEELKGKEFPFPVIFTKGHCEEGTLEYLTSESEPTPKRTLKQSGEQTITGDFS